MGEHVMFCVNCGNRLANSMKYCPKCGEKIANENIESSFSDEKIEEVGLFDNDPVTYSFREKIKKETLEAYLNETKVIRSGLYTKGKLYGITDDIIDDIVADCEKRIILFEEYLYSLYMDGSFLMYDVTDEIKSEIGEYAGKYGFGHVDGERIYEKFVKDHKLRSKNALLLTMLISYQQTGILDDAKIKEEDPETIKFKAKGYLRFKNAVQELKELQSTLHEVSGSIDISDDDRNELYEKGMLLGFQEKTLIDACIQGNEISLGYHGKKMLREQKILRQKNQNYFSKIVRKKTMRLLDREVVFDSCYFIEEYTFSFFEEQFEWLNHQMVQKIKSITENSIDEENFALGLSMHMMQGAATWLQYVEEYCNQIGLPDELLDNIKSFFAEDYRAFGNDLKELRYLFDEIDSDVEQTKLNGELKKAFRGKWVIGGVGIQGMINSAVTGAVLNAGTGLAYDAMNKISTAMSKRNAIQAKKELVYAVIDMMTDYFGMLQQNVPTVILVMIMQEKPYSVSAKYSCGFLNPQVLSII
ncbi:MAG: zinc ribbon domain-containing protein, partial [Eubacteriales bacterium]|nr:zinc ribbon domain-containing protein [Eubacteriales bacterium]